MKIKIFCLLMFLSAPSFAQTKINSVTLTWAWTQGTGAPATAFNVYRATSSAGPFALLGSTAPSVMTYTDATVGALPTGQFYYYVTATNTAANVSAPSAIIGAIPAVTIAAPSSIGAAIK
jgi:hypothetical protein